VCPQSQTFAKVIAHIHLLHRMEKRKRKRVCCSVLMESNIRQSHRTYPFTTLNGKKKKSMLQVCPWSQTFAKVIAHIHLLNQIEKEKKGLLQVCSRSQTFAKVIAHMHLLHEMKKNQTLSSQPN